MILNCSFEELQALTSGAELLLSEPEVGPRGAVAAPAEALAQVAMLQPRLTGDLSIDTLEDQRRVRMAVDAICNRLHEQMDEKVVQFHPAHEEAVAYYFDYAHAFAVLSRLDELGLRMTGILELMTGGDPDAETARRVEFPD